jgi:hypothetical protein
VNVLILDLDPRFRCEVCSFNIHQRLDSFSVQPLLVGKYSSGGGGGEVRPDVGAIGGDDALFVQVQGQYTLVAI